MRERDGIGGEDFARIPADANRHLHAAASITAEEAESVAVCLRCDRQAAWKSDERKFVMHNAAAKLRALALRLDEFRERSERPQAVPSVVPTPVPTCEWRDDGDGLYEASCGLTWTFIDGTPAENNTRFCPGCGESLIVKPAPKYDDDDDEGGPTPAPQEER